jgi:hypothetical protein
MNTLNSVSKQSGAKHLRALWMIKLCDGACGWKRNAE